MGRQCSSWRVCGWEEACYFILEVIIIICQWAYEPKWFCMCLQFNVFPCFIYTLFSIFKLLRHIRRRKGKIETQHTCTCMHNYDLIETFCIKHSICTSVEGMVQTELRFWTGGLHCPLKKHTVIIQWICSIIIIIHSLFIIHSLRKLGQRG